MLRCWRSVRLSQPQHAQRLTRNCEPHSIPVSPFSLTVRPQSLKTQNPSPQIPKGLKKHSHHFPPQDSPGISPTSSRTSGNPRPEARSSPTVRHDSASNSLAFRFSRMLPVRLFAGNSTPLLKYDEGAKDQQYTRALGLQALWNTRT